MLSCLWEFVIAVLRVYGRLGIIGLIVVRNEAKHPLMVEEHFRWESLYNPIMLEGI